jgi:hypothetical protein
MQSKFPSQFFLYWKKLPCVSPEMMVSSRFIKKIFTGKLETKFSLFGFHMTEAEYLKCQIIRILSDCDLMLKGLYEFDEEAKCVKKIEGKIIYPK